MLNFFLKTAPISLLVLLSCCTSSKTNANSARNPNQKNDSIKPSEIKRWTAILNRDNLKIEGNSNIDESMIQSVMVKFEPYVWFEDFPAKTLDTISKSPLDFSTNREAKYYITAIKTGYKEENSTFGGHYELIMWGCGFPCAHGVIVDRKTGRMTHLPESVTGYEFRINSLMLIVNPTDEDGFYNLKDEYLMPPAIYVFDEAKKEFKLLGQKRR